MLRLSSALKDPGQGFTFGRNRERCDICFTADPGRRLSNIHFRIYVNEYGSVLLEDQSTNGTVVDNKLLRRRGEPHADERPFTRRTLESGSTIKIVMHENKWDLIFLVRIPRREGEYEDAYMRNVEPYLQRLNGVDDVNKTIGPGPTGHVRHSTLSFITYTATKPSQGASLRSHEGTRAEQPSQENTEHPEAIEPSSP